MRKFDYSFLINGSLPVQIVNSSMAISELRAKEQTQKRQFPAVFTKLESIAKVQSVKGSNAIEGIITTDKRVEKIVNNNSAPLNHNELEIAGYRDALSNIHDNFANIEISERNILNLHAIMQRYNDNIAGGEYKRMNNSIVAIDSLGNKTIRFQPMSAADTPKAMEQLVLAYMDAQSNSVINQLFLIPCFILDFLRIHPFLDGNGRVSRLLSLLLLYKNGFDAGKYISFEEQINKHMDAYYSALQASSAGWLDGENDYFPFMQNFILTLHMCYKELDSRFTTFSDKKPNAKSRVLHTIEHSLAPLGKQEVADILVDLSINTIAIALGQLVKDGKITKVGDYKNAKYKKK